MVYPDGKPCCAIDIFQSVTTQQSDGRIAVNPADYLGAGVDRTEATRMLRNDLIRQLNQLAQTPHPKSWNNFGPQADAREARNTLDSPIIPEKHTAWITAGINTAKRLDPSIFETRLYREEMQVVAAPDLGVPSRVSSDATGRAIIGVSPYVDRHQVDGKPHPDRIGVTIARAIREVSLGARMLQS